MAVHVNPSRDGVYARIRNTLLSHSVSFTVGAGVGAVGAGVGAVQASVNIIGQQLNNTNQTDVEKLYVNANDDVDKISSAIG